MSIECRYQGAARPYGWGPLYDPISRIFPNYPSKRGIFETAAFSKDLDLTSETLYRAFRSNRLTPAVARRIIELSKADGNHTISRHDLFDYVLPGDD